MAVGWKIIRQIPIFPPHSAPSALQASLKPKDLPRSPIGIVLAAGPLQQGGTAGTKRLICGAYHGFSAPPALQAPALQASLKPEDPPCSLIGIVLALKGCAFPYRSPRGPLQQGGTAGTKRLICGAYHGFSTPPALQASLKPKAQKKAAFRRNAAVFFVAERSGFEPEIRFCRIHAFQACLLSHSSISPECCNFKKLF